MHSDHNQTKKPPSLPDHWPHPTPEDIERKPSRLINVGGEQEFHFCNNFVKTSKYEAWNFLPKFFLEEFNPKTKVANCYFLLISALQCIPQISNTGGYPTTLIPLLVVVLVDGIFQIVEDLARHRADKEANSSKATRYNAATDSFEECLWYELEVGNIVKVKTREMIPADIVILGVAEKYSPPQGLCYVETKSLDGETNLKIRNAMPNTMSWATDQYKFNKLNGNVEMEHPNKVIVSFTGILDIQGKGREAMQANNVLLRGCVLRNTDWVVGLVVNTGHDTKIMMSNTETKPKSSFLETQASIEIQRIIILLSLVCFAGATGQAIWNNKNDMPNIWYLDWDPNPSGYWFIKFFYFFLLHASFIPVSLYVSMSVIRYFQAYFMNLDLQMYYDKTDTRALVRTMTLNEELGQISHIFSDKTGTLTCNIMDFRKMSIAGRSYGQGITEIGKASAKLRGVEIPQEVLDGEEQAKIRCRNVPHVSFYCPTYEKHKQDKSYKKEYDEICEFFRLLAICHDVIPEKVGGEVKLSASNPDDEALVYAAKYFGYEFIDRQENNTIIKTTRDTNAVTVEVLETLAFTSKRKRMSVIVKDNGKIKIITKGADTIMFERIASGQDKIYQATNNHIQEYSEEGLRCLVICERLLNPKEFEAWRAKYRAASTNLEEIERKKRGDPNKIEDLEDEIEKDLIIVGATAIEDRLQEGVPECIDVLARSGINIWVLTGDKQETAINIAVACNLVLPPEFMKQIIVNKHTAPTKEAMEKLFDAEVAEYKKESERSDRVKPRALIIDGPSLIKVVGVDDCKMKLLELSKICKVVVGCRVSPDQKREMVHLIKHGVVGVRTLAIGDGANDVAMIQEAHIGVGIRGEEGLQAVNSSDYAIAQFRFLQQLILKHGRSNYIRMCSLITYMFYKNILMSMCHFWFNFNNAFSGQKYFTEGSIQMFNLIYTSLPILLLGVYDMDLRPETVYNAIKKHERPKAGGHNQVGLYQECIDNKNFKSSAFWSQIAWAMLESVVLSVVPMYTLSNSQPNTGTLDSFWEAGATCFSVVIIVINCKIFFMQSRYHWVHFAVLLGSIGIWYASAFFITSVMFFDYDWYNIFYVLTSDPAYWLTVFLLCVAVLGKELYVNSLANAFQPSQVLQLQENEVFGDIKKDCDSFCCFSSNTYERTPTDQHGVEMLQK